MGPPAKSSNVKDIKKLLKAKAKEAKESLEEDVDELKQKIEAFVDKAGDKISKRKLVRPEIRTDVIGYIYLTVRKASSFVYLNNALVRENDFKGCAGCIQSTTRIATCDFCACGGADACCGQADPFVTVDWVLHNKNGNPGAEGSTLNRIFQSPTIDNDNTPKWNATFPIPVYIPKTHVVGDYPLVRLTVKDDDFSADDTFSDIIGFAQIPLWRFLAAGSDTYTQKLNLRNTNNKDSAGKLTVSYSFHRMNIKPDHQWHVGACYFPTTKGNQVVTYHDAHQTEAPCFRDCKDLTTCWSDLATSIKQARKVILVCGWSVNHETRLRRDSKTTVGELLLARAKAGASVFLLLWADMSSDMMAGGGIMGTSDTKTVKYFDGTPVKCCRVSRNNICFSSGLGGIATRGIYTHHQKLVVMDEPSGALKAFVGGLDITDGRFDTSAHDLFATLDNEHKDDFYNGCLPNASIKSGPREPWHDIHCQVIGRAAYDVAKNFIDRAMLQASYKEDLVRCLRKYDLKSMSKRYQDGTFNCQVLRSIDSAAANFDMSKYRAHFGSKDYIVENSIQMGYVQSIMKAQRHLYFENQYFLGSATNWLEHKDVRCNHNVHRAIVGKIVEKIRNDEPFAVYVLIPLFPEGDPASTPSQEIIHWQFQTIRFMYKEIADAIRKYRPSGGRTPREYLQIFFAGQRHPDVNTTKYIENSTDVNTVAALKSKRHMIYIHSKMLIVDDEYVIIGSANLNERSMAGNRDSEIALASWDTHKVMEDNKGPRGEVYRLRTNLWREHLGSFSETYNEPSSIECVREVARKAQANFDAYFSVTPKALPYGHYCTYPLRVDPSTGEVDVHEGLENFPDTSAPIKGTIGMGNNMMEALTT